MADTEKDLDRGAADNQAEEETKQTGEKSEAADGASNSQTEAADHAEGVSEKTDVQEPEDEQTSDDVEGADTEGAEEAGEDADQSAQGGKDGAEKADAAAGTAKEKKSFFSKKDKNKEKDKDKERIAELEDRVMRQMAEFENFRRRTEKEKQQMFETGARSVIEKILPVVDNFERGLSSIPEAERQGAVAEGMNMIYKQLLTELDNIGVKAIEAVGQEFDPARHNAVMQVASEEYESGVVAQELQKGYTYRDTVIRHSMVAVVE
ncbi:MAG: nucleotide exchange factor GrpE [Lachnospiraceae bacterium]|nr:nucleotide exchange factor GrpE [Lachnospiraceae bacterium]